jgi:deoxyguanosine kinase
MKIQRITYLSLGTNQGDRLKNLQNAIHLIDDHIGVVEKISSIYKTPSWGFEGDDFYNICIEVTTDLTSEILLHSLLDIENKLGRIRSSNQGYENRKIDIDILLIADEILFSKTLTVPHSKMLARKFVLAPLAEIAPTRMHPIEKKQMVLCLQNCNDTSEISIVNKKLQKPVAIS